MTEFVTITKVNETYIHIECTSDIAQEFKEHFSFKAPNYQFMPSFRNKYWKGDVYLFNPATNFIYCGLLPYIQNYCQERGYEIIYNSDFSSKEFSIIEAKNFLETIGLPESRKPRDYQIDAFAHAVRDRRKMLLSPTGSGKSLIIYSLIRYYKKKTLLIVPTTALIHQMYSDFEEYGFNSIDNIHKVYEGQAINSDKPVFCCTWQSIYKLPKKWFSQFGLVIGDEAHLFKAKSLTTIMNKMEHCPYRVGFTGSLDNLEVNILVLQGLFGSIRRVASTAELIEKKYLSEFSIKNIILGYSDEAKKYVNKLDFQGEMEYLILNEKRNRFISNLTISLKGNTLLLYQFVDKHGKPLYDLIKSLAPDRKIYFISGQVDGEERDNIRKIVETENNAIIIASYGTTSTGINIRNLHNIIFASPSKSRIRNLQSIGRVLRMSDNNVAATLYDIADDLTYKNKMNYTLNHFIERIKLYNEEKFRYKVYKVSLNT